MIIIIIIIIIIVNACFRTRVKYNMFALITFPEIFLKKYEKNLQEKLKILYTDYVKCIAIAKRPLPEKSYS